MFNKKIFKRCFCTYRNPRYWYKNLRPRNFVLYIKLMHHLNKYGYDEYATWETFNWFIDTMKSILKQYKEFRWGSPVVIDDFPTGCDNPHYEDKATENENKWDAIIDHLIELLENMDESNEKYNDMSYDGTWKAMEEAKNEFFELFSKYFYALWD